MKAKFQTKPEQFTVFNYVDEFETTTKEIMSEAFTLADDYPETAHIQRALAKAFVAQHSISQPAERWIQLAEAIVWAQFKPSEARSVLTRMTRKGYLRSRQQRGKIFYEVNF